MTPMTKKPKKYTDEFEQFWKGFPARWNRDFQGGTWVKRKKYPAFEKWQKLPGETRAKCLRIIKQIKKAEGGAVRDAVTWLNQYGWDDINEINEIEEAYHLPGSMNVLKSVDTTLNINNERNRQRKKLGL